MLCRSKGLTSFTNVGCSHFHFFNTGFAKAMSGCYQLVVANQFFGHFTSGFLLGGAPTIELLLYLVSICLVFGGTCLAYSIQKV